MQVKEPLKRGALQARGHPRGVSLNIMAIPIVILAGPTGVGKTRVAIDLAERIDGEIIGADSMQIYRYMDIGTAKPTAEERARSPHHLIDIRNPDEEYSAADFARDAAGIIRDVRQRGRVPLIVGGSGLYIHTLLYGIFTGPDRDEAFRAQMQRLTEEEGRRAVYERLRQVDPETAHRLHPNDLVRIIRALEVYHVTGTSISHLQTTATSPLDEYLPCFMVLSGPREWLYDRINQRVEEMIAAGLVEEVRELFRRGYHGGLNPLKSLGYKEIGEFLAGKCDLAAAEALIKRNTRRYAKRQLTWFRKYHDSAWISREPQSSVKSIVDHCVHVVEDCYVK